MAIHFAVMTGNRKIIETIVNDFGASPQDTTTNGLSILHCAAQDEKGTFSIEMFCNDQKYNLQPNNKDSYDCTPLHFAVLNNKIKCVESLLAKGADPNAMNSDNQSPLHIAIISYIQGDF